MMRLTAWVVGSLVMLLAAAPGSAQTTSRRLALEVIGRHVAATGGSAALARIQSLSARGTIHLDGSTETGLVHLAQSRPDQIRMMLEMPHLGTFEEGYDGSGGWSLVGGSTAITATGRELAIVRSLANDFLALAEPASHFDVIEYSGRIPIAGREMDAVRLLSTSRGIEATRYFDPSTGLQSASTIRSRCPEDACEVRTIYTDYQRQGNVSLPMQLQRVAGDLQYSIRLTSVEIKPSARASLASPAATRAAIADVSPRSESAIAAAPGTSSASRDAMEPANSWRDMTYSHGVRYQVQGIDDLVVLAAWIPDEYCAMVFARNEGTGSAHFTPDSISASGEKSKKVGHVPIRVLTAEQWEHKVERRIAWNQALAGAAAGWEAGSQANQQGDTIRYSGQSSYNFNGTVSNGYYKQVGSFSGTAYGSTSGTIQLPPDRTAQELAKIRRMQQMQQVNANLERYYATAMGDLALAETVPRGGVTGGRVHLEKSKLSTLELAVPFGGHTFTFSF